jgi:FkbM family methyltransferase
MNIRPAGILVARFLSTFFSSRAAQRGADMAARFFEALQGIGLGTEFSRREWNSIFAGMPDAGSVIFDAGAHTGEFLREALRRSAADSVFHVFEPAAASFRVLSAAFGGDGRVRLNRLALSCDSGSGVLFYDEPGSQLASLTPRLRFGQAKSEGVRLETLDQYCRAHEIVRIDLLKLDVEGHEMAVLAGATEMLKRQAIGRILFEFGGCHIDARVFFRDLYELLAGSGMRISRVMPSGRLMWIEEYEESLERFRITNYLACL